MKNLYKILKVSENSTTKEIKKAYRELAKIHHPDKGGDEEEFKVIEEAYAILSDDNKRARYDAGEDVFTPEVTLEQEAMNRLYPLFQATVDGYSFEPDHTPLFKEMMGKLRGIEGTIGKDLETAKLEIGDWEVIIKRIKKGSVFKNLAEDNLAKTHNRIKRLNGEIEITNKMKEILEECEYDNEEDIEAKRELSYTINEYRP